jgi:hypothetical protein
LDIFHWQDNPDDRDAEARVNAVKGLVSVCEALTLEKEHSGIQSVEDDMSLFLLIKDKIMTTLLKALDDYSVDNRGDVGSWVREAAMDGLERCTYILCKRDSIGRIDSALELERSADNNQLHSLFDANLATSIVGGICKQAVEKMDKLREAAAKVLQRILYNKIAYVQHIPHREKLEDIVPNVVELKWAVSNTYKFYSIVDESLEFFDGECIIYLRVGTNFFISSFCTIASVWLF